MMIMVLCVVCDTCVICDNLTYNSKNKTKIKKNPKKIKINKLIFFIIREQLNNLVISLSLFYKSN